MGSGLASFTPRSLGAGRSPALLGGQFALESQWNFEIGAFLKTGTRHYAIIIRYYALRSQNAHAADDSLFYDIVFCVHLWRKTSFRAALYCLIAYLHQANHLLLFLFGKSDLAFIYVCVISIR